MRAGREGQRWVRFPGSRPCLSEEASRALPHHKTHDWEILASAASPMLLNTAENCTPQTPDNRSRQAGKDGPSRPSRQPISHSPTRLWGGGAQNQTSRLGVPALPGRQAEAPQIALAGWERAHTYLNARTGRVRLDLLLLSKGGRSTMGVPGPFSGHEPKGKNGRVFLGRRWPQTGKDLLEGRRALQMPNPLPSCQGCPHSKMDRSGGGGADESRRFSPSAELREETHLHFQRPAQSASPPPGMAGGARVYPTALRLGGSRGRPARLSQAPTPTLPSRGPVVLGARLLTACMATSGCLWPA